MQFGQFFGAKIQMRHFCLFSHFHLAQMCKTVNLKNEKINERKNDETTTFTKW